MKTDLSKILSVSGQHGLYNYIAQARSGAVVESLEDKSRRVFDLKSRITSLADISIYTMEAEVKLREVFLKMHEVLGETPAPSPKAVPDYDGDRFYVSHMKKVVEWYNEILKFASFDFTDPEGEEAEEAAAE